MQEIGAYLIGDLLAASQHAIIYHSSDNLVIKTLPLTLTDDASFPSRFENELDRIAQLDHPHILCPHDYGVGYIVMPHFPGGTLDERLELITDSDEALSLLRPLADALDYTHMEGISHRNIKPTNILFDAVGHPFLADFGLSKVLQETFDLLGQEQTVGDPLYLAPEQPTMAGPASDIYALGIIAYQLLTGHYPFTGSDKTLLPVATHRPTLPNTLDSIFVKALAPHPAHRYGSASAFMRALSIALTGEDASQAHSRETSTRTHAITTHSQPVRWLRRCGCMVMIFVWLILLLSPCLFLTVLVQGEATLDLSDRPDHRIRLFKIQGDEVAGFGFSLGTIARENEREICIKTRVRYMMWQGNAPATNYCQCYTKTAGSFVLNSPVDEDCGLLQNQP